MRLGSKVVYLTVFGLMFCIFGNASVLRAEDLTKDEGKYAFTSDWFSHNAALWKRNLGKLRDKPGLTYLEVGVYEGRSFFWVLDNVLTHPSSKAVAIDIFEKEPEQRFLNNLKYSGHSSKVTAIKGLSKHILRELKLNSFDLIYIDGDHTSKSVLTDAVLAWDLLKDDGILIFDDYKWAVSDLPVEARPELALDVFLDFFWDEVDVLADGYQLIVRKNRKGCDLSVGSVQRQDEVLSCSRLGSFLYYWKPRKLYNPSTRRDLPLREGDASLIEKMLTRLRFGLMIEEAKDEEAGSYRSLLNRLGIREIFVPLAEKESGVEKEPARR